mmetsp:Transcript_28026/g.39600  ORF Transcript_28026/g.39600 Transcript_28026/m.39600 type:complete len:292 (-) Transcript_28026:1688-2563(-)|eukprot:CAMPEP_0202443726 /NCGR_PEP_ID=MMETSP1360-20130828/2908_1 /ASSEMBLY_ACC=CAM_ASM_000848 /TAXON_ID=515479 /ORGANISM="Licmophora paradoxa, Strain CCMP2313" /LENGTH=291 /DNA_ID=CAMNT_0049059477 /DNA_START=160 /DNA_END=1035 /DNA_ORIENTATION=+
MVIDWAASSDEDSEIEDESVPPPLQTQTQTQTQTQADPEPDAESASGRTSTELPPHPPVAPRKDFKWPTEAPFTAYVGNLAYSIKAPDELSDKVKNLVKSKLGKDLQIVKSRIALDRQQNNRPKGFGYVELETLHDLKTLMQLADGTSHLSGRPLKLDVAASPRQSSFRSASSSSFGSSGEIDGSKFQGGKFSRSGSFRRQSSGSTDRPTLKLKPRTSLSSGTDKTNTTPSDIFGVGKAREDPGGRSHRPSETARGERSTGGRNTNSKDFRRINSKGDNTRDLRRSNSSKS